MPWLDGTTTGRTLAQLEAALRAIVNATTSAALSITQLANTSASTSVGGALNINNTGNTGAGLVVYSAQSSPSGRLIVARADHATFGQTAMFAQTAGTGHAFHADNTATNNATGSAVNVTSANTGNSAMFVSGVETGRGTVKITHTGTGADGSAACLSLDAAGSGTAAQLIFGDATTTGGTTGDLVDLRNNGVQLFKLKTNGYIAFGNGGPGIAWGSGSPEGVVTAPVGWTYLRSDGNSGSTTYTKASGTGNTGWVATGMVVATTQASDYTLALTDMGRVVEVTKATAHVLTVPPNSSVAFPIGTVIEVLQYGAGQVTITPGSGVTIRTASSLTTRAQYSTVALRKRATDEWVAAGDLT